MRKTSAGKAEPQKRARFRVVAAMLSAAFLLSSCAGTTLLTDSHSTKDTGNSGSRPIVVTSIYPINFIASAVAGPDAQVTSLLPPGGDVHHSEISLRQLRRLQEADILVFLSEFQPAVDQAVITNPPHRIVDVADVIDLQPYTDHSDTAEHHDHDHDHGPNDPHFWLDPANLLAITRTVASDLAEVDPQNAAAYERRAADLGETLTDLQQRYSAQLANCAANTIVVSHAAFGYLTEPLNLTQIGIAGLDPDSEPSLARIRQIRDIVEQHDVTTIFYESPTNPYVAQKVADALGLETAFLDPLEIQNDPDKDYLAVMEQNLINLRTALDCQ